MRTTTRITAFLPLLVIACGRDGLTSTRLTGNSLTPNSSRDIAPTTAFVCPACVYGPKTYTRSLGEPKAETKAFVADPVADYILDVRSGDGKAITGSIVLNGIDLRNSEPLGNDSWKSGHLRLAVKLQFSNELTVRVTGEPGSTLSIFVLGGAKVIAGAGGSMTIPGNGVSIDIPPGALSRATEITGEIASSYPGGTALVSGTVYDMGPSGTSFAKPATLSIGYDPRILPYGISESALQMYHAVNGSWLAVAGSVVDLSTHRIAAPISGFSSYGVGFAAPTLLPGPLAVPIDASALAHVHFSQAYAGFGTLVPNEYHTGLDISANNGSTLPTATPLQVIAAADGYLVLVQENDGVCSPHGPGKGCKDHGFGNTLILEHASGFTQYSHLNSIEPLKILNACGARSAATFRARCISRTAWVSKGTPLGTMGGTGYGAPTYWPIHLHFEVKTFPYMGLNPSGAFSDDCGPSPLGGCGYLATNPNAKGYQSPVVAFHQPAPISLSPSLSSSANLRIGPGSYAGLAYPAIAVLAAGTTLTIASKSGATASPACSQWYQATFPVAARLPYSPGPGSTEEGWVCADQLTTPPGTSSDTVYSPVPFSQEVLESLLARSGQSLVFASHIYFNPSLQSIRRVSVNGGGAVTLATNQGIVRQILTDGANVYWIGDAGASGTQTIFKVPLVGGAVSTIASGLTGALSPSKYNCFATDGASLYFTAFGSGTAWAIKKVPVGGGVVTQLATAGTSYADDCTLSNGTIFYKSGLDLMRVPAAGGSAALVASFVAFTLGNTEVLVVGNMIYVLDGLAIRRVPIAGGASQTVVTGLSGAQDLTSDGQSLFLNDIGTRRMLKIDLSNFFITVLPTPSQPIGLILDAGYRFWISSGNAIIKAPK